MRKRHIYRIIFSSGIALILAVSAYFTMSHSSGKERLTSLKPSLFERSPSHLLNNGPYGNNVVMTDHKGDCRYKIEAGKLYFKNSKFGVFQNALFKKAVAEDLKISIFKGDRLCLKLSKGKEEFAVGMKTMTVIGPQIEYPMNMENVAQVEINKDEGKITFKTVKGKQMIWDMSMI